MASVLGKILALEKSVSAVGVITDCREDLLSKDTNFVGSILIESASSLVGLVVKIQHSPDNVNYEDLITFATKTADGFESVQIDNTNIHLFQYVRANVTAITGGSANVTVILHHDRV